MNKFISCDSVGILFKLIKDSLPVIAFYIMFIVNTSIVTNMFPYLRKIPHIIPLHKVVDVEDVNTYRPISLLPKLSKNIRENCNESTIALFRVKQAFG